MPKITFFVIQEEYLIKESTLTKSVSHIGYSKVSSYMRELLINHTSIDNLRKLFCLFRRFGRLTSPQMHWTGFFSAFSHYQVAKFAPKACADFTLDESSPYAGKKGDLSVSEIIGVSAEWKLSSYWVSQNLAHIFWAALVQFYCS